MQEKEKYCSAADMRKRTLRPFCEMRVIGTSPSFAYEAVLCEESKLFSIAGRSPLGTRNFLARLF